MVWLLDESGLFVRLPIRTDRQTAPHTDRGVAVRSVMSAAPGNGRSLPIRERERGGWVGRSGKSVKRPLEGRKEARRGGVIAATAKSFIRSRVVPFLLIE